MRAKTNSKSETINWHVEWPSPKKSWRRGEVLWATPTPLGVEGTKQGEGGKKPKRCAFWSA